MRNVLVQYVDDPSRIRVIETDKRTRINHQIKLQAASLGNVHTSNFEISLKPDKWYNPEHKKPKSWKKWRNTQWR